MRNSKMLLQLIFTIFLIVFIAHLNQIDENIRTRTFDTRLTIFIHIINYVLLGLILSLPKWFDLLKNKCFGLNIRFLALELVSLTAVYIFSFRPPHALYNFIPATSNIACLCFGVFLPWCFSNKTSKEPPS